MIVWKECGYKDFADGSFGNGGQNIYVSSKGILQRIFHFDLNKDGFIDLVFVNSQDMDERPPSYLYEDPLGKCRLNALPAMGAYSGTMCDLNNDGYDDLIIANQNNGVHSDITAYIYYGSPEGLSERYRTELPAPNSRMVAAGDFDGDSRIELAFISSGKLRVFHQDEKGFVAGNFVDTDLEATHITAGNLTGDGYSDLYIRLINGSPRVLWGGKDGINAERYTIIGGEENNEAQLSRTTPGWMNYDEGWIPKILTIDGKIYLFRSEKDRAMFFPVYSNKTIGTPLIIECKNAVSAAVGDINGDGWDDIVFAVCEDRDIKTSSWIYWGDKNGFTKFNKTEIVTISARDVAVCDLNNNGYADVIICQGRTNIMNTTESLIFQGTKDGIAADPVRLVTHDATTVLTGNTNKSERKQVVFINHVGGRVRGDVPVYVYYGSQNGFSDHNRAELPGWAAPNANCCDFNDDGWADLLICNCSENAPHLDPGSFIYWNSRDGFDPDNKSILPTTRAHGSAVGDFRHSGYLDIAVSGFYNAELLIYRGGENGYDTENPERIILDPDIKEYSPYKTSDLNFWKENKDPSQEQYKEPRWLLSADFNNDGWLDLFVSQCCGQKCYILWGGPDGYSMERSLEIAAEGGIYAQAADLTGNGWLDLVIAGHQCMSKNCRQESYIYIYWGSSEGYREEKRMQLPTHTCNSISIADFNNDGILDIFATSYNSGRERDIYSYLYWGSPGGFYSQYNCSRLFTHSSCGCMSADFNEDGWIDIAVANHKTYGNHVGFSQIFWNSPNGFSESATTLLPTLGPHGMLPIEPFNISDRGQQEYYISSPYKISQDVNYVCRVWWDADMPAKTWVKMQVRLAEREEELEYSPWAGVEGHEEWMDNYQEICLKVHSNKWIQYRLALGAVNGGSSPRVKEVNIAFE